MQNIITPITRKFILEDVIAAPWPWHGRENEVEFLNRIWNLKDLPSLDGRFKNMWGDVFQHRINNDDYPANWIITDERLNIFEADDAIFSKFLSEMLNPLVVQSSAARDHFLAIFNKRLFNDGLEIIPIKYVSGEPIYGTAEVKEAERLHEILMRLEAGVIAVSTDGVFSDSEYMSLREQLRKKPELYQLLPDFIRAYHNTQSIRSKMQTIDKHYAERREYIRKAFLPLFSYLDNLTGITDPFAKTIMPVDDAELIGEGGFGLVYKVKHKYLEQFFAVKIFRRHPFSTGTHDKERFFKEANILFNLNHPAIIRIYDVGLYNDEPFIKMEYFHGRNLNQILTQHGRLKCDKALRLVKTVADALSYAAEKLGVVHRDLKPSNIMAAVPEQFKVIDFGLGVYIEDELRTRLTKTGETVASSAYTAPELQSNPRLINCACDIYSLGAIWYECLLGRVPQGTGIEEALNVEINIPPEHKKVILRSLKSDPNKRFRNWNEFQSTISDLIQ